VPHHSWPGLIQPVERLGDINGVIGIVGSLKRAVVEIPPRFVCSEHIVHTDLVTAELRPMGSRYLSTAVMHIRKGKYVRPLFYTRLTVTVCPKAGFDKKANDMGTFSWDFLRIIKFRRFFGIFEFSNLPTGFYFAATFTRVNIFKLNPKSPFKFLATANIRFLFHFGTSTLE